MTITIPEEAFAVLSDPWVLAAVAHVVTGVMVGIGVARYEYKESLADPKRKYKANNTAESLRSKAAVTGIVAGVFSPVVVAGGAIYALSYPTDWFMKRVILRGIEDAPRPTD